ncbi:rhamnose ABC transporter substrate-binding protein [soil metagenome]
MITLRTAALAFLPLLVFGCAKSGGGGSASGTPTPGGGGGTKLKIVYIPKNTGNPYFNEVDRGFKEAAAKLDMQYDLVAPATAEATSQIPIIKDQIQRGVDIIAISANSPDALNPVLDQAKSRGITIITVDADLVGNESHRDSAVLPADFSQIGPSQVELLAKLMGSEGDFAILSATTDAPNQNAWIAEMLESLKDPKYAKMKLVDTVYGDDEPQKSTTECEALLAKYPNLKGIVSPTSVGLAASAQVLDRAGKKIQLTGLSTPNQLKKFVGNGTVTAFQLWSPRDEGFIAAYVGAQIHSKKIIPAEGTDVDIPDLGKRKFSAKLELTGGPILTFDKSNIDKYDF